MPPNEGLELLPEPIGLEEGGLVVELPLVPSEPEPLPEPIVLEPELLPVEGETAVEPVRLLWSSVELVLPAAYAIDAAPIIRAAAKLLSVKFRINTSSNRFDVSASMSAHPPQTDPSRPPLGFFIRNFSQHSLAVT